MTKMLILAFISFVMTFQTEQSDKLLMLTICLLYDVCVSEYVRLQILFDLWPSVQQPFEITRVLKNWIYNPDLKLWLLQCPLQSCDQNLVTWQPTCYKSPGPSVASAPSRGPDFIPSFGRPPSPNCGFHFFSKSCTPFSRVFERTRRFPKDSREQGM